MTWDAGSYPAILSYEAYVLRAHKTGRVKGGRDANATANAELEQAIGVPVCQPHRGQAAAHDDEGLVQHDCCRVVAFAMDCAGSEGCPKGPVE